MTQDNDDGWVSDDYYSKPVAPEPKSEGPEIEGQSTAVKAARLLKKLNGKLSVSDRTDLERIIELASIRPFEAAARLKDFSEYTKWRNTLPTG